ncbi:hypothetical protein GALL_153430 [mine drainage metagenome]|uniref:Holin n=1 Tax=mine drainage metagenome TaxID=410659 RepID=A0A1J5SEI4_9ZZZZ
MTQRATTAATYAASAGSVILGMTANDFAIYAGVGIAVLTFAVNVWFRWQTLQIMKKAAKDKMIELSVNQS